MNQQKILLFHMNILKAGQIQSICNALGITVTFVKASDYNQQLGALAEIDGFSRTKSTYKGSELSDEMLVFSGMNSDQVDLFLSAYRKNGIAPINLKAIITPHNVFWNVEKLYKELLREHSAMKK